MSVRVSSPSHAGSSYPSSCLCHEKGLQITNYLNVQTFHIFMSTKAEPNACTSSSRKDGELQEISLQCHWS